MKSFCLVLSLKAIHLLDFFFFFCEVGKKPTYVPGCFFSVGKLVKKKLKYICVCADIRAFC